MNMKRLSRQTCRFLQPPGVISCAAVAGRLEGAGPLGSCFDAVAEDSFCGRKMTSDVLHRIKHTSIVT